MMETRRLSPVARVGYYLLAALFVVASIIPFLWMLSTSFKPSSEIYAAPRWIQLDPTLQGYVRAVTTPDVARAGLNSVVVATLTTLLALVLAIGAGYGFARFQFFGRDLLAVSVLFSQWLPSAVVLIPLYLFFDQLHLIDTYPALVLSCLIIVLPLCT